MNYRGAIEQNEKEEEIQKFTMSNRKTYKMPEFNLQGRENFQNYCFYISNISKLKNLLTYDFLQSTLRSTVSRTNTNTYRTIY